MSTNNQAMGGYGFEDDENAGGMSSGSIRFGLNQGTLTLTKFEWIPNGGKDGAEQEALDIEFSVEGREKPIRYRKFPVVKAYDKKNGNAETTDPNNPAFKEAQAELSQVIVHILGCFVDKEAIRASFTSSPIKDFKDLCKRAESLLPVDFSNRPLDAFFQYQWQINGENDKTYLELPKNMKQGKFLVPGTDNTWKEVRNNKILKYVDVADEKIVHPFQRGEWFLQSNFATQQKEGGNETSHETSGGTSAW